MVKLPYGKTAIELKLPASDYKILKSNVDQLKSSEDGSVIVKRAMENPIGSKPLHELAENKNTAVIIISDHTRPVPSKDIIPNMLKELRMGNPDIKITLLVATGFHRATTKEELKLKLGEDIVSSEDIVVHDCADIDSHVKFGVLPSGADLIINRIAAEADLLIAEGFIEPHFFAGFSGGRKSVLPGICGRKTVLGNHCSKFIDSQYARAGILERNPLHTDMIDGARKAGLAYIVNVIIDENKKTVAAFAGDCIKAHETGCEFLKNYCKVKAETADIVITTNGGAPLDQNIYQSVKGLTAAEASAKENAVLIMCAELADGNGSNDFYEALKNCTSPGELYVQFMKTPQDETMPDQWEAQILARILLKHKVIFVTEPKMQKMIEEMKMIYAPDIETAVHMSKEIKGMNPSITVIPDGISVIVEKD